jgi:hypothetical protein
MVRLVAGGGGEVPNRWNAAAGAALARRHVGADGRGVHHCGAAQAEGEPRHGNHMPSRWGGCRHASDRVALRGDARGPLLFRPRLSRALTGASSASRC